MEMKLTDAINASESSGFICSRKSEPVDAFKIVSEKDEFEKHLKKYIGYRDNAYTCHNCKYRHYDVANSLKCGIFNVIKFKVGKHSVCDRFEFNE